MIAGLKPYPTMKDSGVSWLGEVPEHWASAAVKRHYTIQLGKMLQNRQEGPADTEVSYLKAQHVQWFSVRTSPTPKMWASPRDIEQFGIGAGDLLVCEGGEGGRSGIVREMPTAALIIQNALHRARPRDECLNEFLQYVMSAISATGWFDAINNKATIAHFTREKFGALGMPIPPLPEQAAIVRFLDHADRRIRRYIRAKQKLIKLLEEQKQAIIHRAVTRGLDPNVRLKPSGVEWLGDVPEHWEVLTLRRVITRAVDGPHHSPHYLDSGIPFLSARNIKADRWSLDDAKYISEDDYEEFSKRVVPEVGDVLYTKGGTTGVARVVDLTFRFQVWVHVAVLKVKRHRIMPRYLTLALNSPRCYEQAQLFTRGATNQDLGLGRMKGIVFALPPLPEQESLLKALDEQTEAVQGAIYGAAREIDLLREYRTRLIADVVTGKLDVREAVAKLPDEDDEIEGETGEVIDADDSEAPDIEADAEETAA